MLTERVDPGFYFYNAIPRSIRPARPTRNSCRSRSVSDRSSSSSMCRVRGSSPSAGRSSTSPACPTRTLSYLHHGRSAGARRRLPQQGDRHVGARARAICRLSGGPDLKGPSLEVAEVFTRHMGMNPDFKPFADKRVRQAINHAIDTDLIIKPGEGQGLSGDELAAV